MREEGKEISLIGIAGGSASGKTTFTRLVRDHCPEQVAVVSLDSYYLGLKDLSEDERAKTNFDHPSAFDVGVLFEQLQALRSGVAVNVPCYDFATHTRTDTVVHVAPARLVVVEGILVFYWERIRALFDLKIFVDAPDDLRLERRIKRDVAERGRTSESVQRQWNSDVQPMFEQFCLPGRKLADVVIDGRAFGQEEVERIWKLARGSSACCTLAPKSS